MAHVWVAIWVLRQAVQAWVAMRKFFSGAGVGCYMGAPLNCAGVGCYFDAPFTGAGVRCYLDALFSGAVVGCYLDSSLSRASAGCYLDVSFSGVGVGSYLDAPLSGAGVGRYLGAPFSGVIVSDPLSPRRPNIAQTAHGGEGGRGEPQNNMTSTRMGERGGAVYFVQNSARRKIVGNVVQNFRRHGTRKQHKLDKGFHCHKSTHAEFCDQVGSSNMQCLHRGAEYFSVRPQQAQDAKGKRKTTHQFSQDEQFSEMLSYSQYGDIDGAIW